MPMAIAGAGKSRFNLNQNGDINVTPFVDVMLVLLIVMMVTAPMATVAVKMDIPPPHDPQPNAKPPTYVSIADDGRLSVSMGASAVKPTSLDTLGVDVATSLGTRDRAGSEVYVRADRHVRYRRFMEVVNGLKLAGYDRIGVISEDLGG